MAILARVTEELDEHRGADVVHRVSVPEAWLQDGGTLRCVLPRRLACADCEGGGCDRCGRSGVHRLRDPADLEDTVEFRLPPRTSVPAALRIPGHGAAAEQPGHAAGCLILYVSAGEPSAGLTRGTGALPKPWLKPRILWFVMLAAAIVLSMRLLL
jgi:hypothetical protein